jgi:hypothetical protein
MGVQVDGWMNGPSADPRLKLQLHKPPPCIHTITKPRTQIGRSSSSDTTPGKRLRMAPPRDRLQEYLAAQQRRREEEARWSSSSSSPPQGRGGGEREGERGLPGSGFVMRAFEDGLGALSSSSSQQQGQQQGQEWGLEEEGDEFDLLTRLAEVCVWMCVWVGGL